MKRIKLVLSVLPLVLCLRIWSSLQVQAETIYDSPYVDITSGGEAWTTCPGDAHNYYYEEGYTVETGIGSTLRALQVGEHYYMYGRIGEVPVGSWVVRNAAARCIHDDYPNEDTYYGISFGTENCHAPYTQGWFAYCADCKGTVAEVLFYMCEAAAESIRTIPMRKEYYYLCPHCSNLEQGRFLSNHQCKAISMNQYRVRYVANIDEEYVFSMPLESYHMYNNADTYEGKSVEPATKLYKMNISVPGYDFLGWNTEPDGSGVFYRDEEEIYNLSEYDWKLDGRGTIYLYGQWKLSESVLEIDPAGGKYLDDSEITVISRYKDTCYEIEMDKIVPPSGAILSFEVNGGKDVEPIRASMRFEKWLFSEPFAGRLDENRYWFQGNGGSRDRLTAHYATDEIVLPVVQKENASFGGWYFDAEYKRPAGKEGDTIVIVTDTLLYAQWVELNLEAVENYVANEQKGAVDLAWSQQDIKEKVYRVYRYESDEEGDFPEDELATWTFMNSVTGGEDLECVSEKMAYTGETCFYQVPYGGIYVLQAAGAQGESCGSYRGGYGGEAEGSFWLNARDVLTVTVGGRNGFETGGSGTEYGNGGGATIVSSAELGTLLVAGGGGGASMENHGGDGGETNATNLLPEGMPGEDGIAGGGGGYRGGKAALSHTHEEACYISAVSNVGAPFYDTTTYLTTTTHNDRLTTDVSGIAFQAHSAAEVSEYKLQLGNTFTYMETPGEGEIHFALSFYDWGKGNVFEAVRWLEVYSNEGELLLGQDLTALPKSVSEVKETLCADCKNSYSRYTGTLLRNDYFTGVMKYNHPQVHYCDAGYATVNAIWEADIRVTVPISKDVEGIYIVLQCSYSTPDEAGVWFNVEIQDLEYAYRYLSCGKSEIISPAYGGSSFVETALCGTYRFIPGGNNGEGSFSIRSKLLGFYDSMSAEGVAAPDLQPPEKVKTEMVKVQNVTGSEDTFADISWEMPEDKGSKYYFAVESYERETGEKLCVSNIVTKTLTTGIKGYYYLVNTQTQMQLTCENGIFTGKSQIRVRLSEIAQYLHIAPVDFAGNIGETLSVSLGNAESGEIPEVIVPWPIYTDRIELTQNDGVWWAEEDNAYYVKCDGITPIELRFRAYMDGVADLRYQLTHSVYEVMSQEGVKGRNEIVTPLHGIVDEEITTSGGALSVYMEGDFPLHPYMGVRTVRSNQNRELSVKSQYLLGEEAHGKIYRVTPIAGVEVGQISVYSDYEKDLANSIHLIGDCREPEIQGTELLQEMDLFVTEDGEAELVLRAVDRDSGVAEFRVEIYDNANGNSKLYTAGEDGEISIKIEDNAMLIEDEFEIRIAARDNVGNTHTESYRMRRVGLEARVERILVPHTPIFKRGESGVLTVNTYGSAERVEVVFPRELAEYNEVYVYENPQEHNLQGNPQEHNLQDLSLQSLSLWNQSPQNTKEEKIQFMVPLNWANDGEYQIVVRAYKGERILEEVESFWIKGTVLDEIRTRLR